MNQELTIEEKLKAYEALKIVESEAKNAVKEFAYKEDITEFLRDNPKVATDNGLFTYSTRDKWTFSEEVKALEVELKDKETEEIQTGVAVNNPTEIVTYKVNKKTD